MLFNKTKKKEVWEVWQTDIDNGDSIIVVSLRPNYFVLQQINILSRQDYER